MNQPTLEDTFSAFMRLEERYGDTPFSPEEMKLLLDNEMLILEERRASAPLLLASRSADALPRVVHDVQRSQHKLRNDCPCGCIRAPFQECHPQPKLRRNYHRGTHEHVENCRDSRLGDGPAPPELLQSEEAVNDGSRDAPRGLYFDVIHLKLESVLPSLYQSPPPRRPFFHPLYIVAGRVCGGKGEERRDRGVVPVV